MDITRRQARCGSWSNLTKVQKMSQSSPAPVCKSPRRVELVLAPPWPTFLQESRSQEKGPILVWRNRATCHFRGKPSSGGLLCSHPWIGRSVDHCCLGLSRKRLLTSNHWKMPADQPWFKQCSAASLQTTLNGRCSLYRVGWVGFDYPAFPEWDSVSLTFRCLLWLPWPLSRTGAEVLTMAQSQNCSSGSRWTSFVRKTSVFKLSPKVSWSSCRSSSTGRPTAREKGSSSWLNTLPMVEHGFDLTKAAFLDAVSLHYGWESKKLLSTCACWEIFNPAQALQCPNGSLTISRHNKVHDLLVESLREVSPNLSV